MTLPSRVIEVLSLLLAVTAVSAAQEVEFGRDVRPIFAEHCAQCHGPDDSNRMADLHLDQPETFRPETFRMAASGYSVIVPGEPAQSELFRRITSEDELFRMPPALHAPALPPEKIDVIRRWIEQGGEWQPHWAYRPFHEVKPPIISDEARVRNPIDRFVLAGLEREGLTLSPEAARHTLIRRVSLDLIGMSPTADETDAFLADGRVDAYERLVDRLLASPHYAERWARHWLDLARYADSNGFTIDGRRSMWPYRDWVIHAVDDGMPFDQFTIEQLAGDLLPNPTNAQLVATGFHRNTQINQEGGAKDEENRVNAVIDRVNTTGAVWLGSTLGCAQCHTHKFDPLPHVEYYRMFAFFDQTEDGGVSTGPSVQVTDEASAPLLAEFESERARLVAALVTEEHNAARGWMRWAPTIALASEGPELRVAADASIMSVAHNPQTSVYDLEGLAPTIGISALRIEALPDLSLPAHGPGRAKDGSFVLSGIRLFVREAGGDDAFVERRLRGADSGGWAVRSRQGEPHVAVFRLAEPLPRSELEIRLELRQDHGTHHVLGRFRISFADATASEQEVPQTWRDAWRALVAHEEHRPDLPSTLVMKARTNPRVSHVFRRGSFLTPGEAVTPGFPKAMNHFAAGASAKTRLDLARWLVHPENALVHRVTVNRWWQRFFGLGLVETENDFGIRGAEPSHPELLEWFARELVARSFSMKSIHRLIVTSSTYRQSSRARTDLLERDPRNRWLARQSRLRLDAEVIRDSALRASGLLSPVIGGPPVQPPQPDGVFAFTQTKKDWIVSEGADRYRRTIYTRLWRSSP
ncbi:MAG: DUF1549 domain-containing protein [Acidobacteria bacterium]|nr:MAG: DUF1549 domain-containing protein [Acidobacteriota bacterium]